MKKILLIGVWFPTTLLTLVITFFLFSYSSQVKAGGILLKTTAKYHLLDNEYQMYASLPQVLGSFTTAVNTGDARPEIIRQFLARHKSPLESYADLLVATSDKYGLDFRLLVAIAMQESNLCKKIPDDSYNCWGFGIYGDKVHRFKNYEEGIERVAKTLRENYVNKGLVTPEQIMAKYAPPSVDKGGPWAQGIRKFFEELR